MPASASTQDHGTSTARATVATDGERTTAGHPDAGSLQIHDVRFSYGQRLVVDGISADIPAGAIVGVVGPSGCGKSTLLSLIAGLEKPDSGSIARDTPPGRHPKAMVFQKDTLLPWLTAAENVRLHDRFKRRSRRYALGRKHTPDATAERTHELLAMAGLAGHADRYPYQLSGGMRRRLAFLVAVAAEPDLLLLDEPFSSVDEPTRIGIHQDVFRITKHVGTTTILVTHDLAEAVSLCDQIYILCKSPARIVGVHQVPFGPDREMLGLRESPEFLSLYARVWHDLSAQIAAGQDEPALSAGGTTP
jgi:NitT/TauT family transport system ATP-binding protein